MALNFDSVSWNYPSIRLYPCKGPTVTELDYDRGKGWLPGSFGHKEGATVGATSWIDASNRTQIRVYVGNDSTITEWVWDGGWKEGSFKEAGYSATATSWLDKNNNAHVRVYVVGEDNKIHEYVYENGWKQGSFPVPTSSVTSVDSVSWWKDQKSNIRLYFCRGSTVGEILYDGSKWSLEGSFGSKQGATVGATSWLDADNNNQIRVYVGNDSMINEWVWDGGWKEGSFKEAGYSATATSWLDKNNNAHVRVYVRAMDGLVREYKNDGKDWSVGSLPQTFYMDPVT